jgi:SAM-dependent methyltransferase
MRRIRNTKRRGGVPCDEIAHGQVIAAMGEEVWNWSSPAGRARLALRIERFSRVLGTAPGAKRVLELGCGTGLYTERMVPHCRELVAIDISDVLLDRARARVRDQRVQFVRQDLERIDLAHAAAPFDAAFGNSVLHHLDLDEALPRLHRLLAAGAHVAFSEPNLFNPQVRLMFSGWQWAKRKWSVSDSEMAFYPSELLSAFTRTGFDVLEIAPFDFVHPATPARAIPVANTLGRWFERIPIVKMLAGSLFIHARVPIRPSSASGRQPSTSAT